MELIDLVNSVYDFSISSDLTQVVSFPTWIPNCDSHIPVLLDFFLSSNANSYSGHVVVSVSTDFLSNPEGDVPFYCIAHDYSHAYWGGFRDLLGDVSMEGYL